MSNLRSKIIRLAHSNPEIRSHLLPLLKQAGGNYLVQLGIPVDNTLQDAKDWDEELAEEGKSGGYERAVRSVLGLIESHLDEERVGPSVLKVKKTLFDKRRLTVLVEVIPPPAEDFEDTLLAKMEVKFKHALFDAYNDIPGGDWVIPDYIPPSDVEVEVL